jgi:hypothetical protein
VIGVVLSLFVPTALALFLGFKLALAGVFSGGLLLQRLASGLLMIFASEYLLILMSDVHQWNTSFPTTPALHMFGPNWSIEILYGALARLKWSGVIFIVVVTCASFLRRTKAA